MEIDFTFATIILGSVVVLVTALTVLLKAKIDPKHWRDEAKYWEDQATTWKKRHNAKAKQVIQLEGDYQVTGENDSGVAISAIADSIAPMLPPSVRSLIKNPETLNMIAGFAGKHPELVNKILGGLTKKISKGSESENPVTDSNDTA